MQQHAYYQTHHLMSLFGRSRLVILIGLMGSGKSTLGRQLASQAFFSGSFVDLDALIVKQTGKSIPDIFAEKGAASFRELESRCLAETLQLPGKKVIATGGGAILSATNRALMKERGGAIIWLDASPEMLAERISGDKNRPLLDGANPLEKMITLTEQRNPLYAEIADLRIDTGVLSNKEAVAKIMTFLSDYSA